MNKIILSLFFFSFLNCSSQLKINKGTDIDILTEIPQKQNTNNNYLIKNNSNTTYIIDPFGFYGESSIVVNNVVQKPISFWGGHYYRINEDQCINDLIILKPYESIEINLNLASNDDAIYDYKQFTNFIRIVKSSHNKNTIMLHGCKPYIEKLEKQGYRVLEDSIDAKIPYIK
jgi:hypothetical protein